MKPYVEPEIEVVKLDEDAEIFTSGSCCDIKVDEGGTIIPGPGWGGTITCDSWLSDWGGD